MITSVHVDARHAVSALERIRRREPQTQAGGDDEGGRVSLFTTLTTFRRANTGVRRSASMWALARHEGRVRFAHSGLSGYSVFEEALYQGGRVAGQVVGALARGG